MISILHGVVISEAEEVSASVPTSEEATATNSNSGGNAIGNAFGSVIGGSSADNDFSNSKVRDV